MVTAARTARSNSRSNPSFVPSPSIELRRISPTPSSSPRRAHSMASIPADSVPPCVVTSKPDGAYSSRHRRASTDSTMHWAPKISAMSRSSSGFLMAAVFTETLSAPARSNSRTSSTLRTPPPTVNGINTWSAVRRTTSSMVERPCLDAETSKKVSSSAPRAS